MESAKVAKVVIAACVVSTVLVVYWGVQSYQHPKPQPVTPSATAAIPPLASSAPEAATQPEAGILEELLPKTYSNGGQCLTLTSREADAGVWTLPYPYQLVVTKISNSDVELDCGLFATKQKAGWRLGYCLDGNDRVARKVYLQTQGDTLGVQVDYKAAEKTASIYAGFRQGACK